MLAISSLLSKLGGIYNLRMGERHHNFWYCNNRGGSIHNLLTVQQRKAGRTTKHIKACAPPHKKSAQQQLIYMIIKHQCFLFVFYYFSSMPAIPLVFAKLLLQGNYVALNTMVSIFVSTSESLRTYLNLNH